MLASNFIPAVKLGMCCYVSIGATIKARASMSNEGIIIG